VYRKTLLRSEETEITKSKVIESNELRSVLGISDVNYVQGRHAPAVWAHLSLRNNSALFHYLLKEDVGRMKKKYLSRALVSAIQLAIAAALLFGSTRVKGADVKSAPAEVRVDNFTFGPDTITVPVNSSVTWVNKDDVPHVIASNDGLFKSKALDTDDKYSYTFTKAGTYLYYCSIHPKMVGKVIVQ
jgi:plastocyanin